MSHSPGPSIPRAVRIELRQPVLTQCDRGAQEVAHPSGRIQIRSSRVQAQNLSEGVCPPSSPPPKHPGQNEELLNQASMIMSLVFPPKPSPLRVMIHPWIWLLVSPRQEFTGLHPAPAQVETCNMKRSLRDLVSLLHLDSHTAT